MAEKGAIFQTVQLGVEVTSGTAVAANKKLGAVSVALKPEIQTLRNRPNGSKYATGVVANKKWSTFAVEQGTMSYADIVYVLSSLLNAPTPTQQAATTAYKWAFAPSTFAEDAGKTYTIEQGDATTAWRIAGARFSSVEMTFTREGVNLAGGGIGKKIEKGVTLTAGPTSVEPAWVLPEHVTFKMADSQAGLAGAAAMTRGFSLGFSLSNKVDLAWPVGADPYTLETEPDAKAKLRLATDAVGMGLFDTLEAGATKWFRVKATGPLIASTYYHDIQLDFAAMIESIPGFGSEGPAHVIEYGLEVIHNGTWGKAFTIDVINTLTAL